MELRKIFDTIPEQFDQYRPRYSPELFRSLAQYAALAPGKSVLEIGPGTGQATGPVLDTGCDYLAVELGENLYRKMQQNFGHYNNFNIINDDFITCDLGKSRFDLVYSAATIQWIPEEVAFPKIFSLLKPGGTLAMMLTRSDYRASNEHLYQKIQQIYSRWYKPEMPYQQRFCYGNATNWGFKDFEKRRFSGTRVLDADAYVAYCGTHCDHMTIAQPQRTAFFDELRQAVAEAGNKIVFEDTYVLYLAKKPEER